VLQPAQLLLNIILALAQCAMGRVVVVKMQQDGAGSVGMGRGLPILPASGPVKGRQIL
jgi:hypothetical protein